MAGRYIPPHMRGSTESTSVGVISTKTERKPEDGYTLEEICNQYSFDHKKQLGTLNRASKFVEEEEKHTLGFVIVFKGQHPDWPPRIFCKTNLFLLPRTDTLPSMWYHNPYTCPNTSHKTARLCSRSPLFLLTLNIRLIVLVCLWNERR